MLWSCRHQERDQHAAGDRQGRIQPPADLGNLDRGRTPASNAEDEKAVDDGGQSHRKCAEEHRHDRVAKDASRFVKEQDPARGVEAEADREDTDIQQPQHLGEVVQFRDCDGHLIQCQPEDARTL